MKELIEFTWIRATTGEFRWIDTRLQHFGERRFLPYFPLTENPGLFRIFANLDPQNLGPNTNGLADFAKRWGVLQGDLKETLGLWQWEVSLMKTCVWLLDQVRDNNEPGLQKLDAPEIVRETIKSRVKWDFNLPAPYGSYLVLAQRLMTDLANVQLHQHSVHVYIAYENTDYQSLDPLAQAIELRPENLISTLWLQFVHVATGTKKIRKCAFKKCENYFEISSKLKRRRTRKYCSDSCRVKQCYAKRSERDG